MFWRLLIPVVLLLTRDLMKLVSVASDDPEYRSAAYLKKAHCAPELARVFTLLSITPYLEGAWSQGRQFPYSMF